MVIKLLLILPIIFEAVSEGLYLRGKKLLSKQIQVLLIASWFVCMWLVPFGWQAVVVYVLLRFAVFNYVHNLSAGIPLNYLGNVSIIDKLLPIVSLGNFWFIMVAQVICLIFAYLIAFNKL